VLAVIALQALADTCSVPAVRSTVFAAVLLGVLATAGWETVLRHRLLQSEDRPARDRIGVTDAERHAHSAAIAQSLGISPNARANLAYVEVQERYALTDNFTVLSLDGITDDRLKSYVCGTWIDHDGYFIDSKADFVMDFPDFNADRTRWSLASLDALPIGSIVVHPGLTYTKVAPNIARVTRTVPSAKDRPGGICGSATLQP
jgi:hypothetical protein